MLGKDRCVRLVALVALVALVLAGSLVPGSRIPGVAAAGNPFIGHNFITPLTGQDVRNTESSWQTTRPADAAALHVLDQTQVALWVTSGFTNSAAQSWVQQNVDYYDDPSRNGVPIIAPYALASPSCGGGGLTGTTYQSWINAIATGINGRRVVITLEPDSLLQFCSNQGDRQAGLSYAVSVFKQNPNATVYLDGAHYGSSLSSQASYLYNSNIAQADGFFVNSTLYDYVGDSVYYGEQLAQTLCSNVGVCGKHFVVDVSRSSRGNAFTGDTQNTRGRGLGAQPTTNTIDTNIVDAFLWIKPVWESDGGRSGDPGGGANMDREQRCLCPNRTLSRSHLADTFQ